MAGGIGSYSNGSSTLTVNNTIVTGSSTAAAVTTSDLVAANGGGGSTTVSGSTNLITTVAPATAASFDAFTQAQVVIADLSALGYNGGPTMTEIPLGGSPALKNGTVVRCPVIPANPSSISVRS